MIYYDKWNTRYDEILVLFNSITNSRERKKHITDINTNKTLWRQTKKNTTNDSDIPNINNTDNRNISIHFGLFVDFIKECWSCAECYCSTNITIMDSFNAQMRFQKKIISCDDFLYSDKTLP